MIIIDIALQSRLAACEIREVIYWLPNQQIVPFVEDHRNILILAPTTLLDLEAMATLQAALKRGRSTRTAVVLATPSPVHAAALLDKGYTVVDIVTHNMKDFRRVPELKVQAIKPADFLNLLRS